MKLGLSRNSASLRALAGTSLGSLPGFLLPFALSWRFHAGRLTDAYFLSFAIATFVAGILSSVLEVNIMPAAAAHKRSGGKSLTSLVRKTIRNSVGIAAVAYIPTALIGIAIVDRQHSWSSSEKTLCIVLIFIFSLYILATAVTSILDGTLYALGQFFVPTLSQGMRTLLPLMFILLTPRNDSGVIFTASLLVGGEIVRGGLLFRLLATKLAAVGAGDGLAAPPSRLLEASLPFALSLLVANGAPLTDKIVASPLGAGSVTVIELAEKVFFVPLVAITSSVVLVAGSRWASLAQDKPEGLSQDYRRTLKRLVALSTAAAVLVGTATTLATLIAGQHFLGLHASQFRALVLIFVAGLPGALIISHGARLMTAMQRTRLLPLFALVAFSGNLGADIVGAHLLGVDGIAFASTLLRYVGAGLYLWTCSLVLTAASSDSPDAVPFLLR